MVECAESNGSPVRRAQEGMENMPKNRLEETIAKAAGSFALEILAAVKGSSLQELLALSKGGVKVAERKKTRRGRKPKKVKAAKVKKAKKAGRPRKKRVVKNYPKCAHPGCNKNRFPRGKGYCGAHWRLWKEGKIPAAPKK
jgi:hypothetical protein